MKRLYMLLCAVIFMFVLAFSNVSMMKAEEPTIVDSDWEEVSSKNEQSTSESPKVTTANNNEATTSKSEENTTKRENPITTKPFNGQNGNAKKETTTKLIKAPGKVKSVKITASKKSLKIKWKKMSGINKYQIQVSTSKKFKKGVIKKSSKNTSLVVKKLKAKRKYYIRVRAIRTSGKQIKYGKWSTVVNKKTK